MWVEVAQLCLSRPATQLALLRLVTREHAFHEEGRAERHDEAQRRAELRDGDEAAVRLRCPANERGHNAHHGADAHVDAYVDTPSRTGCWDCMGN